MTSALYPEKGSLYSILLFGALFLLLAVSPAHALILPPDPFDITDRYALLVPASDGTITGVMARVSLPGTPSPDGELMAIVTYKRPLSPGRKTFQSSASGLVSVQELSTTSPALITFDFSAEPIPADAYNRTLRIYYQSNPESAPVLISEYRPEQLLPRPSGDTVKTSLAASETARDGVLVFGPVTILREREIPRTEQLTFSIDDASGPFLLRLTNGTSEGTHRAASAVVKLNGADVFRPSEFNQKSAGLSRQVVLQSGENTLEVRLRSAPGAYVTLEIVRFDGHVCRALGPQTFIRATGKPITETVTFSLSPQLTGPFTVSVTNGNPDGTSRADSAVISLNGQEIVSPADLNEQIERLSRTTTLRTNNTLTVELHGAPGDLLTLEITGYDSTPPHVNVTSPSSGDIVSVSPITVTGTVDDPYASVTVNGTLATVSSDGTFTAEGVALQEGENALTVNATDDCGNEGQDQILVYLRTIVTKGPELLFCAERFHEYLPQPPVEGCSKQVLNKYYGVVTAIVDASAVTVTLNGILMPDGVEIYEQGDIYYGMREGNFIWAYVNLPPFDGIHPYTMVAANAEGESTTETVTFLQDTVPPIVTITSPPDNTVTKESAITITGSVDDPEAVVRLSWPYSSPAIPVVDGIFTTQATLYPWDTTNYISVIATDPSGNIGLASFSVTRDTTLPQLTVTSPVDGMATNLQTVAVTGAITDQNPDSVIVTVNNGAPQALTLAKTTVSGAVGLTSGTNTLQFTASDKAGNTSTFTRTVILDQELPIAAITSPLPESSLSGVATITIAATDALSSVASVTLLIDGQVHSTLTQAPYNFSLDTQQYSAGSHTLIARVIDAAGNQTETSIPVVILDQTPPTAAITAPLPNGNLTGTVTVTVTATDNYSGIQSVSLFVDDHALGTLTQTPYNFSLDTLQYSAGSHTLTARVIDAAGNQTETSIPVIIQDQTPPLAAITAPLPNSNLTGTVTVTVTATDNYSGIQSVSLFVDDQALGILTQVPYSFSLDTLRYSAGSHTLTARAIDNAGNQAETSIPVTIQKQLAIEISSPANGSYINKTKALVRGTINPYTNPEVGVTVNGIVAHQNGNNFAVLVPLQTGQNTITAVISNAYGVKEETAITINTETINEYIRLTVNPESGIPVLKQDGSTSFNATLEAVAYLPNTIASYSWDTNGDGIPEQTGAALSKISVSYASPGIYFPAVTITDSMSNTYTETTVVNVLDSATMNILLKTKWGEMKGFLKVNDVNSALNYLGEGIKTKFNRIFSLLGANLSDIVVQLPDINLISIRGNIAKYYMKKLENGTEYAYFIYFMRDANGFWKIENF